MMVPRSYHYSSNAPTKPTRSNWDDMAAVGVDERKANKIAGKEETAKTTTAYPKMFTPSPPTPSKPVVIPTRARNGVGGRKKSRESVSKDRRQVAEVTHDPSSTPSLVTALPAMTPSESGSSAQADARRRSFSFARLKMQESRFRETPKRSISSSSPQSWGMLLSPPEESEQDNGSFESETTLGPLSSVRSLSTESMPSLETDTDSLSSASSPATPGIANSNRLNNDRRHKILSTSRGEDCIADHPLLLPIPQALVEDRSSDEESSLVPLTQSPLPISRLYLKSNLTASLRKIRSAAQSFSAFTASPTQRDDYIARPLISPESQFTDERRPLPSSEPPDPALRRYLNPVTFSPAELHFHSEESAQVTRSSCTTSIQLQTYRRRTRGSDKASSPPLFTSAQQKALDAVDGLPEPFLPRQREPRENSDFLRVIVLEMDMRKKGKLSDNSPGRARLWLPARQTGSILEGSTSERNVDDRQWRKVPARWKGISA